MLQDNFLEVYDKFKLEFFRRIFELVREREGSLSAMEAFSIEIIHALNEPTIGRFAEFLNISQSNATYKVNNLIKKGYLKSRTPTPTAENITLFCRRSTITIPISCAATSKPSSAGSRRASRKRSLSCFRTCSCAYRPK